MKKFFAFLTVFVLLCNTFALPVVAAKTENKPINPACLPICLGDVDKDHYITPADARTILRAAVGLESLSDDQMDLADWDHDGEITPADARIVLRTAVGLEDLHIVFGAVHGEMIDHVCADCGAIENGYAYTKIRQWIQDNATGYADGYAYTDAIIYDEYGNEFGLLFTCAPETNVITVMYDDTEYGYGYILHFCLPYNNGISYAYYEEYDLSDYESPVVTTRAESYFEAASVSLYYSFPFTAYEGAEDEQDVHIANANALLHLGITGLQYLFAEEGINITLENLGFPNLLTNEK